MNSKVPVCIDVYLLMYAVGYPCVLRSDCGTENSLLSFYQPFLRRNHTDSQAVSSFRYGKLISNQVLVSPNFLGL